MTNDQIEQMILDALKGYNLQPNTIFPIMPVHTKLQSAGLTSEEINGVLERMINKNWLKSSSGPHWTITQGGYDQLGTHLSDDQVEREILNVIKGYNPRPDEIFPVMQLQVKLPSIGNTRINEALNRMVAKGWLKPGNGPHWKITAAGHAKL